MKMFPILFDYRIKDEIAAVRDGFGVSVVVALPWPMIEAHQKQALKNHSQTIDRLAERGGLSASEACAVLEDRKWRSMTPPEAHSRLKDLFTQWLMVSTTNALFFKSIGGE